MKSALWELDGYIAPLSIFVYSCMNVDDAR